MAKTILDESRKEIEEMKKEILKKKELEESRAKLQAELESLRQSYIKEYDHNIRVETMLLTMYINFWEVERSILLNFVARGPKTVKYKM